MYLESADDLVDQRNEFLNVPRLEQNKENIWSLKLERTEKPQNSRTKIYLSNRHW